jgi:hypothetical protein
MWGGWLLKTPLALIRVLLMEIIGWRGGWLLVGLVVETSDTQSSFVKARQSEPKSPESRILPCHKEKECTRYAPPPPHLLRRLRMNMKRYEKGGVFSDGARR